LTRKILIYFLVSAFLSMTSIPLFAQYNAVGNAIRESCRCYTLTTNTSLQRGAVWNVNRINLSQSFDFTFDVFLGCSDGGADGIAFVLQPLSPTRTSTFTGGGGLACAGFNPSLAVTIDTYSNRDPGNIDHNDPSYDHIAIQLNGDLSHYTANTITPPTQASATSLNVEDCNTHKLRIKWDAVSTTMTVFFDGQQRVSAVRDLVNTVFAGNGLVYWGFTGATGGLSNLQRFCSPLTPGFNFAPTQRKCVGEAITFFDSTTTFSNLVKWYWDFGDGSNIDSVNANPSHVYTASGNYIVRYRVIALDGCEETFTKPVYIGAKPVASFTYNDSCLSNSIQFNSTSTTATGSINSWYWNFDNAGLTSTISNPTSTYNTDGVKTIQMVVGTNEGCISDTLYRTIRILPRSVSNFTFTDSVCIGAPTRFTDQSQLNGGLVNFWQWTSNDPGFVSSNQNPTYTFPAPGNYTISLTTSGNGSNLCPGTTITKTVFVVDKPKADFRDVIPCERQSITLQDSSYTTDGHSISSCWWNFGNGQFSNSCNPTFTFPNSGSFPIQHTVINERGCVSDTLNDILTIADKPLPDFTMSPIICGDSSLVFTDISTMQYGQAAQWKWIHNNTVFSNNNPTRGFFPYGNQRVGLVVTSSNGCFSDTIYKTFKLVRKPLIGFDFQDTCKFDPVFFSAQENGIPTNITQWNWNLGDGTNQSAPSFTHVYQANGAYPVSLYVITADGCSSDTLRDVINIYGTNAFAGNDTIVAAGQPVQLQASGGISYSWSPSDGLNNTGISNPIATVNQDKTYYLKAYTPGGCPSYDTINIIIYQGPEFYMPTAFTPNGDGLNDVIKPFLVGVKRFDHFIVYNRYGQTIFQTTRQGYGWDGTFKGSRQPAGTYVWQISGEDYTGKKMFKKGTIILLR
jgi:gliding motility-associated-like protein